MNTRPLSVHALPPAAALPDAGGLEVTLLQVDTGQADYDLTLALERRPDGLHATLSYATDVYPAATVDRLADSYLAVLRAATDDPGTRLAALARAVGGR